MVGGDCTRKRGGGKRFFKKIDTPTTLVEKILVMPDEIQAIDRVLLHVAFSRRRKGIADEG